MAIERVMYPGSFDPPTLGHLDLIERGSRMFSELVVAVGVNPDKEPFFSADERVSMLEELTSALDNVSVTSFSGLVVECARREDCGALLRGLRTVSDFEWEYQMALANRRLFRGLETVFMMPDERHGFTSSRLIREIVRMGGDASEFLAPLVRERIEARMKDKE